MKPGGLQRLIEALLYEGYVLYPYRPSSSKNRRERFTFGRIYPQPYSSAQNGAEPCIMQTECLACCGTGRMELQVSIRFLHLIARDIGAFEQPVAEYRGGIDSKLKLVEELRAGDRLYQTWQEAIEREVLVPMPPIENNFPVEVKSRFRFLAWHELEPIWDGQLAVGLVSRRQETLEGAVEVSVCSIGERLRKLTVRVLNQTPMTDPELNDAQAVAMRTLASTHTILRIEGGEFISLMDPPSEAKPAAEGCRNIGTWPVLVAGETGEDRRTMLSSPIILYDYPQIAPQSAGPLFDGTEIDELLSLRILTMTDQEKLEMRAVDEHARRLLERTESLPEQSLLRMHGVMSRSGLTPPPVEFDDFFGAHKPLEGVSVQGVFLRAGDRVRIRPKARADVMDLALSGQTAVIEAVEQDLEKRVHLALVLENDPGKDLGLLRQPGHRFFYGVDEVEPLQEEAK